MIDDAATFSPVATADRSTIATRLAHLNEIGLALSSERDIERLLALILTKARELTLADAGSLYIVETSDEADALFFRLSQNDSILLHSQPSFPVSSSSLAGYAALTGQAIRCDDAYQLPHDAPYSFSPSSDLDNGYHTRSVLVVPMKNHKREVIGVLQLINRKRRDVLLHSPSDVAREVIAFDDELAHVAAVLASQAAVALENNLLLAEVRRLLGEIEDTLDSFVRASASLIDNRDPATAGHSERVTKLTLSMARAATESSDERFGNIHFSARELQELSYAGLLHDVGKIGVRDYIFTKSHKLQSDHFADVLHRIALRESARRLEAARAQIDALRELSGDEVESRCAQIAADLEIELAALHADRKWLERANDPSVPSLPEEFANQQAALNRLAALTYRNAHEQTLPILDLEEIAALSVRRGSLTPEERRHIEEHARMSFDFLRQIRWNRDFTRIPDIAHCHHEKLNGCGYPRGISGDEISLASRMMTVADIFDALTAADRPYKPVMPIEKALAILREEAARGELDSDVVELFIARELYRAA